jgi:hypothetical protein
MTISHSFIAFNSFAKDAKYIVTATLLPFMLGIVLWLIPISAVRTHPAGSLCVLFIWWSLVWAWAFRRSWNRERSEVERLKQLLIDEYVVLIGKLRLSLSPAVVVPSEAETQYYLKQINGDPKLIREAVNKFRSENPDSYHGPVQGVMTR